MLMAAAAAPAVLCAAAVQGAEAPKEIKEYFPCAPGTDLMNGAVVRMEISEDFQAMHEALMQKLQQLPEADREEITKGMPPNTALNYSPKLWSSKKDYDAYLAAWKKTKVVPVIPVGMDMKEDRDKPGEWRALALTKNNRGLEPMTIANLRYRKEGNVWVSPNGELHAEPFSTGVNCAFGTMTGTQWSLENKDSFSHTQERVTVAKSTDGKFVYVSYVLVEISPISGRVLTNHGYMMRFPVDTPRAGATKPGQR